MWTTWSFKGAAAQLFKGRRVSLRSPGARWLGGPQRWRQVRTSIDSEQREGGFFLFFFISKHFKDRGQSWSEAHVAAERIE